MNKDYLIFEYTHTEKYKDYFGYAIGEAPYVFQRKLYFPKIIIEKYINNLNLIKYEDKQILNQKEKKINNTKMMEQLKKKEPKGLPNIGGICYMNALLQCFYYCLPMTNYFLELDGNSIKELGIMSKGYYNFVNNLFLGCNNPAQNFKDAVMFIDKSFIGTEGKDSKDLAILTLSEINQELKKNNNSILYSNEIESNPYNKISVYEEKLALDKINNNSTIISDTFFYDILYEQICESKINCEYSNLYYDIQSDNIIIFELEKIYNKIHKGNTSNFSISIEECLENYSKEERIKCPFCNTNTLKLKKMICSLPQIFIFVMSRGKDAKFKCKINFKKEIEMGKFYNPVSEKYRSYNTKYELIGATLAFDWYKGSGHTIAFCKTYKNNEYYIFNDSKAWKSDFSKIKDNIPYILFYGRKK